MSGDTKTDDAVALPEAATADHAVRPHAVMVFDTARAVIDEDYAAPNDEETQLLLKILARLAARLKD